MKQKERQKATSKLQVHKVTFKQSLKKNYMMYLFLVIPILYFIIFKYIPMTGNITAFRTYIAGGSYFGEKWVGLSYFKMFIGDAHFWHVFKNTVVLSLLVICITFPLPIIFALMLNEVNNKIFKKTVQSITIIPKFLSTVVVVMIITSILSPSTGIINGVIEHFGGETINFLTEPGWFRAIYIFSELWQFLGWNSIIYMAVLSSADQEQYEAAMVDGANRWKQTIHITMPLLRPTIAINLIIAVGCAMNVGFEKILLLYKPATYSTADVIQTYVFRMGLINKNYSFATAVGLFQSLICIILLVVVNKIINKKWECGLW